MRAGIIAAGYGSRFIQAGWKQPKPLIPICGKPLIEHTLGNLLQAGVKEITILLNGEQHTDPVAHHLSRSHNVSSLTIWRKTTRSSYESFSFVYQRLGTPPFVISTVDTLYDVAELKHFLDLSGYDPSGRLVLGVTGFIHDAHPLWVELKDDGRITDIGEGVTQKRYVTAGIYLILKPLPMPEPERFAALRDYLSYVARQDRWVLGRNINKAIDVDCPEDVAIAESFLKSSRT